MRRLRSFSLACVIVGLFAVHASADTISWGGGTGNWNVAGNWVGGVLPTAGDTAVIASGSPMINVTLSPGPDVVRVDPGGDVNFTGAANANSWQLNGGTFRMTGDSNPNVSGPILLTADSTILNARANNNRSFTLSGTISEDATPRRLIFSGLATDVTVVKGANTYSGGTIINSQVGVSSSGGLGTGPVTLNSGAALRLSYSGAYAFGPVTATDAAVRISNVNLTIQNLTLTMTNGTLAFPAGGNAPSTLDNTNTIQINGTVGIVQPSGYYNGPFRIGTSISGSGKAVLNDFSGARVQFAAAQQWSGGTDVKNVVEMLGAQSWGSPAGGILPGGTVTVYPNAHAYGSAILVLNNNVSGSNGGLHPDTDLVLSHNGAVYGNVSVSTTVIVRSLTVDGAVIPAGFYTSADLPGFIVGSGKIRVMTPDVGPAAIADLAGIAADWFQVSLTWTAPADNIDPAVTRYDIRYATSPIDTDNWDDATQAVGYPAPLAPGQSQTFEITGLTGGTTYYFAVRSADSGDNLSGLSNIATVTTPVQDVTAPAAVSDLQAVDVDTRKCTLTWTASGNDGNTGTAVSYDIRMSATPITEANFLAAQVVPQEMAPKAAGQTETLLVTGLEPGATYWFALKVSDRVPHVSGLSNVVQVTMLVDTTPPAPVADLAADIGDGFGVDLTWTASGDDGSVGTATRYEIRFSKNPITEGSWSDATIIPNNLAPQPAGVSEHFTAGGLQPDTTYYFALKVADEEDNISGLSNVATITTGALPALPLVTSVTIVEKGGVTTAHYPLTLSMVFKKGDVPSNVVARASGAVLTTQTDVKVRYDDGSVKHALVSFLLPNLPAGGQVTVDFLSGGPNAIAYPITRTQLLARDFDAKMIVTVGGETTTISARQMLAQTADVETWLSGDVCTEFLLKDFSTNIADQLNIQYRVRIYNGYAGIRVDTVAENCWTQYRGNLAYDFDLVLGQANPLSVFSRTAFTHNFNARWHKVFWQDATPPAIQVRYDVPYRIATGLIPRYDTSVVQSENTMKSRYSSWSNRPHDIMDSGIIETYFPTTGGREEIGIYPAWAARYVLSMDDRMREIMLNCGDLSGSIPVHLRESDPARSFYGRIMSLDDRPTVWAGWWDYAWQNAADRLPPPIGSTSTVWSVDGAHQASFAYFPYLFSGEYYYLEEMYFWAGWDVADSNYGYRGGAQGWLVDQTRGLAWKVRNLADAANMAPDGAPEKVYLTTKLNNNLTHWVSTYVNSPNYPSIRYWQAQSNQDRNDSALAANCTHYTSPWMDDFVTAALGHLQDIGYNAQALIDWFGESLIQRFSAPGFNPFRGAPYHIPVKYDNGTGQAVPYATWADINNAFVDPVGPTSFPSADYGTSYNFIARGAMTYAVHLPNGRATWNWLNSNLHVAPSSDFSVDPTWALLPPSPAGDVTGDGHVDASDLAALSASWGKTTGEDGFNPVCDLNHDGVVNIVDLLMLAGDWEI